MSYDDAIALIKEKRPKTNPNEGFIKQLKEYEGELLLKKVAPSVRSRKNRFHFKTPNSPYNCFRKQKKLQI